MADLMLKDVTIIVMTNPFRPVDSRTIHRRAWEPGRTVEEYLAGLRYPTFTGVELVVSLSGRVLPQDELSRLSPLPGDAIVVCPVLMGGGGGGDGKSSGRLLAQVAVLAASVAVAWAVPHMIPAAWGLSTAAVGAIQAAAAGAVSLGGGLLINALMPLPKPDKPLLGTSSGSDFESSPTYGWDTARNLSHQGIPIPVIYGTHRVAGNVIASHLDVAETTQTLNLLIALCEGEITSVSDIEINGNPVGNYSGVEYEVKLGTLDQTAPSYFNELVQEQAVNVALYDGTITGWQTRTTSGNAVTALRVDFSFPRGMFIIKSDGKLSPISIEVNLEYRKVGDTTWTSWLAGYTIAGATRSPFWRSFRVEDLEAAQYEVRARVYTVAACGSSPCEQTCYWSTLAEIYDVSLNYPGTALLAIRALATNQLSGGQPTVTCVVHRDTVDVYDEDLATWTTKPATNPAWAAYDILVNTLTGAGINHSRIDWTAWKAWADYCDEDVDGEARHICNIVFDSPMSVWDALQKLCQLSRANIVIRGTQFSVVIDKAGSPVQLFSSGNIVQGSFQEQYLAMTERAEEIEVTYFDADKDYGRMMVTLIDPDSDSTLPVRSQITLFGCTSRNQAIREATFRLNCNRLIRRTYSFSVDVDALACTVGDIVYLQHDVPNYGVGGRVVSGTLNTVTLDQEVTLEVGETYKIVVRHDDDTIDERTVEAVTVETTTDTLTVTADFSAVPEQYAPYAFGTSGSVYKLARVVSITRDQDLRRRITCVEYNEDVYDDSATVEEPETTVYKRQVSDLQVNEWLERYGNTVRTMLSIGWVRSDFYGGAVIYISRNGGEEEALATVDQYTTSYEWEEIDGDSLRIRVVALDLSGIQAPREEAPTIDHVVVGKSALPEDVTNFVIHVAGDRLSATWDPVSDIDLDYYEIRYTPQTSGGTWGSSQVWLTEVRDVQTSLPLASGTWMIKAVDTGGRYSANAASVVTTAAGIAALNVVETIDEAADGWPGTLTDLVNPGDGPQLDGIGLFDDIPDFDSVTNLDIYGGLEDEGYYYFDDSIDLGAKYGCRVTATTTIVLLDYGDSVDDRTGNVDDWPNWDTNIDVDAGAYVEMRYSDDAVSWTDWERVLVNDVQARYLEFRIYVYTTDQAVNVRLDSATVTVDMPDRVEGEEDVSVGVSGLSVTFSSAFKATPAVGVTVQNAQSGDVVSITSKSRTGFTVQVTNGGSGVARTVDWIAKGYGKAA